MAFQKRQRHRCNGAEAAKRMAGLYNPDSTPLPDDWHLRLPDPATYYGQRIERLSKPNRSGWAQARCPFHDDTNASLSVNLTGRGFFVCFACNVRGDMIDFHQRLTGMPFKGALRDMAGGRL